MSSDPAWRRRPQLSPITRVFLIVAGWLLVLLGIVGLVLPGLQGVLTLVLAAAVLSLVSTRVLELMRYFFRPWPKGWRRLLQMRRRIARWLEERGF